jgi:hypothetical protein
MTGLLDVVMAAEVTDESIECADVLIRWYLLTHDTLDKTIRGGKDKADIIAKYNYMCLMNIPGMMKMFGPLRLLWEGNYRDEGILRFIKPLITQGLRLLWQIHSLKNYFVGKSLDAVMGGLFEDKPKCMFVVNALQSMASNIRKYESQAQLELAINEVRCKSKVLVHAVVIDTGETCHMYGVCGNYESLTLLSPIDAESSVLSKFGLHYYKTTALQSNLQWSDVVLRNELMGHMARHYPFHS